MNYEEDDNFTPGSPQRKTSCRGMGRYDTKEAAKAHWEAQKKASGRRIPKAERPFHCKLCRAFHTGIRE